MYLSAAGRAAVVYGINKEYKNYKVSKYENNELFVSTNVKYFIILCYFIYLVFYLEPLYHDVSEKVPT